MANILVLPSEVVGEAESGNSYAFPADNIIMSDKTTSVEEAINNKPGEKIPGTEEDSVGGEIFNDYTNNIASGVGSHAEGAYTTASGAGSHAEGAATTASGAYSHAEGYGTTASEMSSHAEGSYTIAASECQHVQGRYNAEDSEGIYAHIVGWGTSSSARANIHTITTGGDGWFAGKVSAGTVDSPAEPTENNDLITKKYFDENIVKDYTELDNIPTMNSIPISGDKSAVDYGLKPNDYIVTFTSDDSNTYTCDKTFEEILAACKSGAIVKANVDNLVIHPEVVNYTDTVISFEKQRMSSYVQVLMASTLIKVNIKDLVPTSNILGMIRADTKTDEDIIPARIGEDNKLYVSAKPLELVVNITGEEGALTSDTSSTDIISAIENNKDVYVLYEGYKYEYISSTSTSVTFEREFGLHKINIKIDGTTATYTDTEYEVSGSSTSGVGQLYPNEVDEVNNPMGVPGEIFNVYENDEDYGIRKNIASGAYSHAEGFTATASGAYSHAEGAITTASGMGSHAEGNSSDAIGDYSHAEGSNTTASGRYSHAEGYRTTASTDCQHVQGKYNIEDADGVYAHIVGWGTSDGDRKNINTIDTNGNGWFAGKVSAGTEDSPATPTADNDLITKKYFDDNVGSSGGGGEQGITNVIVHTTSVGPTIVGSFGNLTQLPSGYTYDNTVILGFYISTDSSIYFGGSCPAFNIRITNTNYIQINVTNNTYQQELTGASIRFILANINLPTGTSLTN